jgi:hypothetical protein
MIDAAAASELAGGLSPVRVLAVIDDVIRTKLAQALELGGRRRGRNDARTRGFGELQREIDTPPVPWTSTVSPGWTCASTNSPRQAVSAAQGSVAASACV